ncbi:hypothetical protein D1647_01015 [Alistipes sp. Z76]|nr:hypothetical protein [Alistipes sp. Z76]NCE66763.1 hypothetical protein [Muribaculaceae bacterium M3]
MKGMWRNIARKGSRTLLATSGGASDSWVGAGGIERRIRAARHDKRRILNVDSSGRPVRFHSLAQIMTV